MSKEFMEPKISIVIAAFNVEDLITRCVQSCLNQDYGNLEIVVVNDGSTDSTRERLHLCQKKETSHSLIVLDQVNRGLVNARKVGVEKASGEYCFFADGDDYLMENSISVLASSIEEDVDLVVGRYNIGNEVDGYVTRDYGFRKGTALDLLSSMYMSSLVNIWGNLIRTNVLRIINYHEELPRSIGEDLVGMTQICLHLTGKVKFVNTVSYVYVQRSSSIIGKARHKSIWLEGYKALILTYAYINDADLGDKNIKISFSKLIMVYQLNILRFPNELWPYKDSIKVHRRYLVKNLRYTIRGNGVLKASVIFAAMIVPNITSKLIKYLYANT